ncbi:MAG: ABC transporter ATP-binding protein [Candidatus Bipolaricaulota bacterium]|nr:ABC transporter ATP-binding protein [Candidatus Bipolaricaulota bacterium]
MALQGFSIETQDLTRVFRVKRREARGQSREIVALDRVTLTVRRGELFGVLGPNGAGKTTLIKILATLLSPTSGTARVLGIDVAQNPWEVRRRIGMVSGGESSGYGLLTVEENLWMFAQFYGIPGREARRRIRELLAIVGLADRARTKVYHLSSGMRQKMNFARGFLTEPEVLFLDEPTIGLDVGTARALRTYIREWLDEHPDRTILLTTHYMHEADELCDRVAIIDRGRVLACDAPAALKRGLQGEAVFRLTVDGEGDLGALLANAHGVVRFTAEARDGPTELSLILADEGALVPVLAALQGAGARLLSLEKREPTLEDVFLRLVGRALSEGEADAASR